MGKKDDFLGMPHGTAANRLRKQILFKYVKLVGDHFCSKCGAEIESVDDLSIEHVKPWEGRDVELFWDLDNIAFSHRACNRPHDVSRDQLRKIGPEGTAWCMDCKSFLPTTEFVIDRSRWDNTTNSCKPCRAKRKRIRRANGVPANKA